MSEQAPPAVVGRHRASLYAANATLFGESPLLTALHGAARSLLLRSGETLFRQGDVGDALYVVTHGTLEVFADNPGEPPRTLAMIGRGSVVGEMAMLVGETRSATVRAVRDSEVLRIDKEVFDALLVDRPDVGVEIARALVRRLRSTSAGRPVQRLPRTVTLLPATDADRRAAGALAQSLAFALSRPEMQIGVGPTGAIAVTVESVDRELAAGASKLAPGEPNEARVVEWLSSLEDAHRFVLFCADSLTSPWTARCVRQADLVLVVARVHANVAKSDAGTVEARTLVERALDAARDVPARRELVLLHPHDALWPKRTKPWTGASGIAAVHNIRIEHDADMQRLARSIAGKSIGVVLGGGGARAFAHIGVLRAIEECGLPVDVIGGASMGAVIAALWASGHDHAAITDLCRRHYGPEAPDRTIPITALRSGHQSVRNLRAMLGSRYAEDLWTRYFAVTASLTKARVRVHESGQLWLLARMTTAIPGLTPPVAIDGELLADGGILDNLPVTAMRERCSGRVIASDVSVAVDLIPREGAETKPAVSGWPLLWERVNPMGGPPSFPSIVEIVERTAVLGSVRDSHASGRLADLHLQPPVDEYAMTSFAAIDQLAEIGYRHAMQRLEDWKG